MYVHIGSECVRVSNAPSLVSLTVTRGQFGTDALRWRIDGTDGSLSPSWIRITDRPERFESRRARLYAYGDGDNPQGNGSHVWMGVVSTEPAMDGPATLTALRGLPPLANTQVVFMTAKVQAAEVQHYKSLGAIDVIAKPFDPMTLADQVRAAWKLA
jgi:hypothetical protein